MCDHLNTHTKGAFYQAFPPERAREYVRRIQFVYTPEHGSWLNVAECELSCLTRQCLTDRRIGDLATLQAEIAAWSARVNDNQRAVDWPFTMDKVRIKLKRLDPKREPGPCTSLVALRASVTSRTVISLRGLYEPPAAARAHPVESAGQRGECDRLREGHDRPECERGPVGVVPANDRAVIPLPRRPGLPSRIRWWRLPGLSSMIV